MIELLITVGLLAVLLTILIAWGANALKSAKVKRTYAAMNSALSMAQLLNQKSLIQPDHRLANFYWVQPHTAPAGTTPTWKGKAEARQMSSDEFLVFLASQVSLTSAALESISPDHLIGTPVPAAWNVPLGARGTATVDVFEQDPGQPLALSKKLDSPEFHLVSGGDGYPLRGLVDSWGHEMAYRLTSHQDILNLADTEIPTPPLNLRIRERVAQDEAATQARYAAMGRPIAPAEYVRPAMAGYFSPMVVSPGPDGLWGAFVDGSPPLRNAQNPDARDADAKDNLYSVEWGR